MRKLFQISNWVLLFPAVSTFNVASCLCNSDFWPTEVECRPAESASPTDAFVVCVGCSDAAVAVTYKGKLIVSNSNAGWREIDVPVVTFLRSATYGEGLFVVVGGSYVDEHSVIFTSRDGERWTRRRSGVAANLYGVAFGAGLYVSVGDEGTLLISKDGITWRRQAAPASQTLLCGIAFGNGTFVATGEEGVILASTDGAASWQKQASGTSVYLERVVFENGVFSAISARGARLHSSDGIFWIPDLLPFPEFRSERSGRHYDERSFQQKSINTTTSRSSRKWLK